MIQVNRSHARVPIYNSLVAQHLSIEYHSIMSGYPEKSRRIIFIGAVGLMQF